MKRNAFLSLVGGTPFAGGLPLLAACSSGGSAAPVPPAPQARILQLAQAFTAAWNVHDAQAFAQTFTPTADFTNVYGVQAHGRTAIEQFHAHVFATVFKDSRQTIDALDIPAVSGSSVTVYAHWSMTGATIAGWPPVQHGIITWSLVEKPDASWSIAVMTNALA